MIIRMLKRDAKIKGTYYNSSKREFIFIALDADYCSVDILEELLKKFSKEEAQEFIQTQKTFRHFIMYCTEDTDPVRDIRFTEIRSKN